MSFLNLPTEIRWRIYSDIFVQDGPIKFITSKSKFDPLLTRVGRQDLCAAFLRVNKQVNAEATVFLYSRNCFKFPNVYVIPIPPTDCSSSELVAYIAPLLRQIGSNTNLLRHISIGLPITVVSDSSDFLPADRLRVFRLIQHTCTDLRTIEIEWKAPHARLSSWGVNQIAQILKRIDDATFQTMGSLEKISMICEEYIIRGHTRDFYQNVMEILPSSKWHIELTTTTLPWWFRIPDPVMVEPGEFEELNWNLEEISNGTGEENRRYGPSHIAAGGISIMGGIN